MPGAPAKAVEMFEKAVALDGTNPDMNDILAFAQEEIKEDNYVPVAEEKVRFETMF